MALVFCDGFDSYAATADLLKKWARADSSWVWGTGVDQNGATGGIISCASPAAVSHIRPKGDLLGGATRIAFGFWLKISAIPAANVDIVQWYNSKSEGLGSLRVRPTTGFFELLSSASGSVFIGTTNTSDNVWHWIELAVQIGNNTLQRCVIDSTSQWNGNGSMASSGAIDRVSFLSINARTMSLSDVMLYNDAGTDFTVAANFPLTARKITTKRPDGDDVIQLGRSTGTTSYTLIDEVNADVADYVEGLTAVQDTYNYAAIGISPTTVNAVVVNSYIYNPVPGSINCKALARSGATTTEGTSTLIPAATPVVLQQPFYVDPNTAAAWTQAGIDAARFGIKVEGPTGAVIYCGQTAPGGVAASYSFSSVYIGPPSADRIVVALFYGQTNNRTVGNVTIGGVAATINVQSNDAGTNFDDVGLCIASLVVPAGTTATIAMAWDGFCDLTGLMVYAIYGASSMIPIDTAHGASSSVNPTAQIDVNNNGAIIALYMNMGNPTVSWTGLNSKNADFNVSGGGGTSRVSTAHQTGLSDETNRTITVLQSSYPEMGAFIAASWPFQTTGFPLDAYATGLTGAWSMQRKLRSGYVGALYATSGSIVINIADQTNGGRPFTAASLGPALGTLGSLTCATFNSSTWTSMGGVSGMAASNFITASAGFWVWVGNIDALPPSFARLIHDVAHENFSMLVMAANNAQNYNFSTGSNQIATALGGTGKHVITWRHEGSVLYVSVDGGTEASIASGDTAGLLGNMELSNSTSGAQAFDGKFVELYVWNVVPSAGDRTAIIAQAKTLLGI